MRHLEHEFVYWIHISTDIKNTVRQYAIYVEHQQTWPCKNIIPYKMPQNCERW